MTVGNAKIYIAEVTGAQGSATKLPLAAEALAAAMEDLTHRHDWSWLLMDTARSFDVTSCGTTISSTAVTHASNGLAGVLAGMTVTGTGIAASTTVASVASDGSLTLSQNATASGTVTLTFGGTIPIIAGTDQYKLRRKFFKPYSCHLVSTQKRRLSYVEASQMDNISHDQSIQGRVGAYTIYNGADFDATGSMATYIKFYRVPQEADVARLRFYRSMQFSSTDADTVDVDGRYLYLLLDLARVLFLQQQDAQARKLPQLRSDIEFRIARAIGKDFVVGGEDSMERIKTPNEMSRYSDGGFFPTNYDQVYP